LVVSTMFMLEMFSIDVDRILLAPHISKSTMALECAAAKFFNEEPILLETQKSTFRSE
jgi:hypothetical protein